MGWPGENVVTTDSDGNVKKKLERAETAMKLCSLLGRIRTELDTLCQLR